MLRVVLESNDAAALEVLKAHARELEVTVVADEKNDGEEETPDEYYYWKGVKVRKAKGELDIKKLSGAFPNLGLDPETYRKDLWSRNKE